MSFVFKRCIQLCTISDIFNSPTQHPKVKALQKKNPQILVFQLLQVCCQIALDEELSCNTNDLPGYDGLFMWLGLVRQRQKTWLLVY